MSASRSRKAGEADPVAANRWRTRLLLGAFVASVVVLGTALGALGGRAGIGALVALGVAVAAGSAAWRGGGDMILSRCGAQPADGADFPRYHNLVEGLCVAGGVPKPRLFVIPTSAADALAVGCDAHRASLAVTTGLLEALNRVELEAVIAHELHHIKSRDIVVATLAATLVGLPTGGRLMGLVLDHHREWQADVTGVALTRYPPALASALEKVRDGGGARPGGHLSAWLGIASTPGLLDQRIVALRDR